MGNTLPTQDKIQKVREYILSNRRASVEELTKYLNVSGVTIRKILNYLAAHGFVVRSYGGAVLAESPTVLKSVKTRSEMAVNEKKAIARVCSNLIEDWENIILDAGSTTLIIARFLRNRKLRIITNSLPIADELCDSDSEASVEILGGTLRKASASVIGPQVCRALEKMRVDKAIIGCSGFNLKLGFSCQNSIEAETKKAMLQCAAQKIIVCDHSKFEKSAFAIFAAPSEIDIVITDHKPEKSILESLRNNGVKIIIAK
ncbi:MAG TPA: DeoR/GlpR family DNA-binding transcription regulator [Victivallales bacterium]|nr:DeoR/GlpR family DNA-binding transcription regulator [Victivallales bacterium]HPO89519.1 DeoR/GlpR family DNA-binding transcription regulator [Victivallales bacterium]HRU00876.1 DeoR/GlpR family DNA-binding transcription regulator [Victivallales bacterium]